MGIFERFYEALGVANREYVIKLEQRCSELQLETLALRRELDAVGRVDDVQRIAALEAALKSLLKSVKKMSNEYCDTETQMIIRTATAILENT